MRHTFYLQFICILVPLLLLFLLHTLPVQLHIIYKSRGHKWKLQLRLGFFKGRLGLKIDLPPPGTSLQRQALLLNRKRVAASFNFKPGKKDAIFLLQWRRWRDLLTAIRRIIGDCRKLLQRSVCTRLSWETGFGLGDYAATGMAAGLLWAGKGLILGLLLRYLRINQEGVRIAVVPRFGSAFCVSTLDCILETSLGYIIIVTLKLGAIGLFQNAGLFVRGIRNA